jgi:hypothetical protein
MHTRSAVLALVCTLAGKPALAEDVHGRVEVQDSGAFAPSGSLDALLGARDRNDLTSNIRLTWEPSWERWSASVHYVVAVDYGDAVRLMRAETGLLPSPPNAWFNLTNIFEDRVNFRATQGIDRLSIAYSAPEFVVRIGRQALTWGGGLVFRPMDLFDPFSPDATDTEFKSGADMVYAQWLFADGSDLQAIVVPRPAVKGAQPSANASSIALHYRTTLGEFQATGFVARDHGDWTAALELSGPLRGASWDLELVPTFLARGPIRVSALANISVATMLLDRNATLFAEYFHNGFGITRGDATFSSLPPELLDRLSRGQVFNLRQNYLTTGLTLEWTPLLHLSPALIADLDDTSIYALASATYSLSDNLNLVAGAQIPVGSKNSEFGGIRLSGAAPETIGAGRQIYLQLRRYF